MILVDERIGSRDLAPPLAELCAPVPVELRRLQHGDFAFATDHGPLGPAWVGIERKKVSELMGDIEEGRFVGNQMAPMLRRYDFNYLIIEGWSRRNHQSGQLEIPRGNPQDRQWIRIGDYRRLDSHLNTLRLMTPIHVVKAPRWADTVMEIHLLYHWFSKPWGDHASHLRFPVKAKSRIEMTEPGIVRRVAKEFDNIGWERSIAVEGIFDSVQAMGNSNQEQWELIDGIGPGRAAKIIRQIRGEEKEKGKWKP